MKLGDLVMIKPDSRFDLGSLYNRSGVVGRVLGTMNDKGWVGVEWAYRNGNSYQKRDLINLSSSEQQTN